MIKPDLVGTSRLPVTRKRFNENSRELPSSLEEVPGEVGEQSFDYVCVEDIFQP